MNGVGAAASAVTVASGATLGGSGTLSGVLSDSGIVSPGPSFGSTGTGILSTGAATFGSGSSFNVDLNGTTAGSGYDQLNVTGAASLGSGGNAAALDLHLGPNFSASSGATFTILATTSGVSGTFSGLPQNSPMTLGNQVFTISYQGGSGDNVVLNYLGSVTTTTVALTNGTNSSTYGGALTFTATVTSTSLPTGSVEFYDGTTALGAGSTLSGSGDSATSSLTISSLSAGTHSMIYAAFTPTGLFDGSESSDLSQTVNPLAVHLTGSRMYDGAASASYSILTVANAVGNDNVTVISGTATLAGSNLGSEAITSIGTLALSGTSASDYTLSGATGSVTIGQAVPTIALNFVAEYQVGPTIGNGATVTGSSGVPATTLENVGVVLTYFDSNGNNLGTTAPTALGNYSVVGSFAGSTDYRAVTTAPFHFSILDLAVTINAFANNSYTNLAGPQFTTVAGIASDSSPGETITSVAVSLEQNSTGHYWNGTAFSGTTETFSIIPTGLAAWTANLPAATSLPDGIYTAQAEMSDSGGNNGFSALATFEVDKTAPTASITSGPAQPYSTSTSAMFAFSAVDPTVNQASSGVGSLQYELDNGSWTTVTNPLTLTATTATSSLTLTGLSQGAHQMAVRAIDNAGNIGNASTTYAWNVDTIGPTTSIVAFGNSGYTNLASPQFTTVTGTAADSLGVTSVAISLEQNSTGQYWNGTTFSGTTQTFSIIPTGTTSWAASLPSADSLPDGVYTVAAQAPDTLGNIGSSTPATFDVDLTPPTASVASGPNSVTNSTTATFTISAADPTVNGVSSGVASIQYELDGGSWNTGTSPVVFSGLSNGAHNFAVRAIDDAGNIGVASTNYAWTVNTVPPTASIGAFGNSGYTNLASPQFTTVTGTAADTVAVASVVISLENSAGMYWNGTSFSSSTEIFATSASGTTAWAAGIPASGTVPDGVYTVQAEATDTAGNIGLSPTATFDLDRTAPLASVLTGPSAVSGGSTATLTFSAADPTVNGVSSGVASLQYELDGGSWTTATSPVTLTSLQEGAHTFAVRAIDHAGNIGAASAPYSWTTVGGAIGVGGLEFVTLRPFTAQNSVYTATSQVQVGFIPAVGQTFIPLMNLAGTTTINTSTSTFSNVGTASAVITGGSTTLLSAGFPTSTSIASLTGSGVGGLSGSAFTVVDSAFTLNTIALTNQNPSSPEIHLQGSLALSGGMTGPVNQGNFVDLNSSGISLTGITAPAQKFSFGALTMTPSNMTFGILSNGVSFFGSSSVAVTGLGTATFEIAGDFRNGALADLSLTLDPTSSLTLAGATVRPAATNPFELTYSSQNQQYTISGGAVASVPGMGSAIGVTAAGTVTKGSLQNLVLSISTAATLTIGSVSVASSATTPMVMTYSSTGNSFALSGAAIADVPALGSAIDVTAGGTISSDALKSLNLAAATDASLSVVGVGISSSSSNPFTLNYTSSTSSQVTFSGAGTVTLPGLGSAVSVTASGTVSSDTLQSLNLAVASSASLSVAGISVSSSSTSPFTLEYLASANNQLTVAGGALVNVPGLGNAIAVSVTSGVFSSDMLESLALAVAGNANMTVHGVSMSSSTSNPLTLSYLASANSLLTMAGAATITAPDLSGGPINVTAAGSASGNALQTLSLTIASNTSLSVAGVTLSTSNANPFVLTYSPAELDLAGSLTATLPATTGSFTVSGTGSIVNHSLSSLALTAGASNTQFTLGGLTIAPSDLELLYQSSTKTIAVSGDSIVTFPYIGPVATGISAADNATGLVAFSLTATANVPITVGGVTITPSALSFAYHAGSGYALSGGATVAFPTFGPFVTSISGSVANNVLQSLTFSATTANTSVTIAGATIAPTNLALTYTGATGVTTLSGSAVVGLLTFGDVATTVSGTFSADTLQSLSLTASSGNASVDLAGAVFNPTGLTFNYILGSGFTLGGEGTVTFPTLGAVVITASGNFDSTGTLTAFTLTAAATFDFDGVSLAPPGLTFTYEASGGYTLFGTVNIDFPSLGDFDVTASGAISNSMLQNLSLVETGSNVAGLEVGPLTITPKDLSLSYTAGQAGLAVSATAHLQATAGLLTIDTDATLGATFGTGGLQTVSLGIAELPSNTSIAFSLYSGGPSLSGALSGPLMLTYSLATGEFSIGTPSAPVTETLTASNFPGLSNATETVSFSIAVNPATEQVEGGSVALPGTASIVVDTAELLSLSVTKPAFAFDAGTESLSINATSASVSLFDGLASLQTGALSLQFQNGTLSTASISNVSGSLNVIANEDYANLSDFNFSYVAGVRGSFTVSGTGSVHLSLPGFSIDPSFTLPSIDFSTGTLFTLPPINLNLNIPGISLDGSVVVGFGYSLTDLTPDITVTSDDGDTISVGLLGTATASATLGSFYNSTLYQPGLTFEPLLYGGTPVQANIHQLNGSFTIPYVAKVSVSDVNVSYTLSTVSFDLSGSASLTLMGLGSGTLTAVLGNESEPGIEISNGKLEALNATISEGSLSILNLLTGTITQPVIVNYSASSESLLVSGAISATLGSASTGALLDVSLGTAASPGIDIQQGVVESLNATATGSVSLAGIPLADVSVGLSYGASTVNSVPINVVAVGPLASGSSGTGLAGALSSIIGGASQVTASHGSELEIWGNCAGHDPRYWKCPDSLRLE